MSSSDLFNQARSKREEAMRLLRQAGALFTAGKTLSATFGSTTQTFGSEIWRGPNATRAVHLLDDCHGNLRYCTGQIFDDVTAVRLRARELVDAAEILESDGRMMARVEAEAEAARAATAAAEAARVSAAQASAQAASAASAAAKSNGSSGAVATSSAATTPVLTFAPIATTTTAATNSTSSASSANQSNQSNSSHDDSDYSGWY